MWWSLVVVLKYVLLDLVQLEVLDVGENLLLRRVVTEPVHQHDAPVDGGGPGEGDCQRRPHKLFAAVLDTVRARRLRQSSRSEHRNRVWNPAVAAARLCGRLAPAEGDEYRQGECGPKFCVDPRHQIRRFPPQIMRHTAASWLVQDGVLLYDVQAPLGHESFATTQRYAHLAPDAHSRVIEAWAKRAGAPVAHDAKEGRSS